MASNKNFIVGVVGMGRKRTIGTVVEGFYCRCKGCGKTPEELVEYKMLAEENGYKTAEEAVRNEEGTFNPVTGLFWCTNCYIKAGMPSGKA